VSSSIRPPYSVTLSTPTCGPASTYVPRLSIFFVVEVHLLLLVLVCTTCCVVMC
jgi:hypothetical protein